MIKTKVIFMVTLCLFYNVTTKTIFAQTYDKTSKAEVNDFQKSLKVKQIILGGKPSDVKQLLEAGYDVNGNYACTSMLNKAIQSLIANEDDMSTPDDSIEKIKIIIEAGADVNLEVCRMTPLAVATSLPAQIKEVAARYSKTIDSQMDSSPDMCNVNGISKPCKQTTSEEREQMKKEVFKIFAEEQKKLEPYFAKIVDILVESGADINKKSNGVTPLHFASNIPQGGSTKLLEHLLKKGANPNIQDFQGSTPLFVANFANNKEVIDILIRAGADTTIRNNEGLLYHEFKTGESYSHY